MVNKVINSFPGYEFKRDEKTGKWMNWYRGEDVGFGGYVYSEPGMYGRTTVLDVSGQHPASIRAMNAFGEYTDRFGELVDLRVAIKHKDFDTAKHMLNGAVAKYLDDPKMAKALSQALKIAVNSCYGLTSAGFDNPMRDPRNKNNIVALRGALFMVTLRDEVVKKGYKVISIKTDSMKIVNADDKIISFVKDFGIKYGYQFEIENIFEKICLVNDSTFIAKCAADDPEMPGKWYPKAAQFQVPYVFKTLFSHEPITFDDMCETKSVTTSLYLDFNEGLKEDEHNYQFIGKVGQFTPVKEGFGGGVLLREKEGKYSAVTGTKKKDKSGVYRWYESEALRKIVNYETVIDTSYFNILANEAIETINKFGDFNEFVSDDSFMSIPEGAEGEYDFMNPPQVA